MLLTAPGDLLNHLAERDAGRRDEGWGEPERRHGYGIDVAAEGKAKHKREKEQMISRETRQGTAQLQDKAGD